MYQCMYMTSAHHKSAKISRSVRLGLLATADCSNQLDLIAWNRLSDRQSALIGRYVQAGQGCISLEVKVLLDPHDLGLSLAWFKHFLLHRLLPMEFMDNALRNRVCRWTCKTWLRRLWICGVFVCFEKCKFITSQSAIHLFFGLQEKFPPLCCG